VTDDKKKKKKKPGQLMCTLLTISISVDNKIICTVVVTVKKSMTMFFGHLQHYQQQHFDLIIIGLSS